MIKFIARKTNDDGTTSKILGLGISEGNVVKLKQNMPIRVDLHDLGLTEGPLRYVDLFYGGTDQDLADMIKPMVGPESVRCEQKKFHEG